MDSQRSKTFKKTISVRDVTFRNSKDIPFQRWYPYMEGYSPNFVKSLIQEYCHDATLIYEPFAGTGTTLFSADFQGIDTVYSEVNPLLRHLISAKMMSMRLEPERRARLSADILAVRDTVFERIAGCDADEALAKSYAEVFGNSRYFPGDQYDKILRLKTFIRRVKGGDSQLGILLDIAVMSCLIPVSFLKKQGDLRFKNEREMRKEMCRLEDILPVKMTQIAEDVSNLDFVIRGHHALVTENAKDIAAAETGRQIDAVITSPPYLNGTNYFRNTKLELWFLSYLESEKDLRKFRDMALTSGINDVRLVVGPSSDGPDSPALRRTMARLEKEAYDRRIPVMVRCYFDEMAEFFSGLAGHLAPGADVLVDLGDSVFSGVHVRTDRILAEVIAGYGYRLRKRVVLRQRRSRNGASLSQVLLVFKYDG